MIAKSCLLNKENNNYIKKIIEILAPVLLGVKPAEFLSFQKLESKHINRLEKVQYYIDRCSKISYKVIDFDNKSIKMFIYNPETLDNCLKEHRNYSFLKKIGYPVEYSLDGYLNILIEKIKMGSIPDEIGIFLGYPLKDVIGFMGHPSLKLTKIRGWRVYGDPRLSDTKYSEFINAKQKIKNALKYASPEILLNAI
jgi:hypothetical protein